VQLHIRSVQAFTPSETAAILATADASNAWASAGIHVDHGVVQSVREAELLGAEADPALFAQCRDRLLAATRDLVAELAPQTVLAEMQMVRYRVGGKYVDHRDILKGAPRELSLVCYLNDDFEGGATTFPEPGTVVQPTNGMALLFSPMLLHRSEPVTRGTKYVFTAWYHAT
jgi:predicted 2-oxoglutarate/Fe(II)-dependent dioxygenase YbiX